MAASSSPSQESTPTVASGRQDESATIGVTPAGAGDGELGDLPGRTIGRYVVGSMVGSGAMGMVYRAFDPELERYVAIKVISPQVSDAGLSRQRLLREARALAKIEHPNVVTVHDVGIVEGRVFIAMEFIDGGDLKQWLRTKPNEERRDWRAVVDKFVAAGEGLAAAHAAGLVHRDFKPANVLMREGGRVLVSDFGLVRESSSQEITAGTTEISSEAPGGGLTVTGSVLGTPAYMAPEQFRGHPADERCDQFAFCVALWEALAGQRPFFPYGTSEMYFRVIKRPPRIPQDDVPRELYELLQQGLSVEPDERHVSMDELVEALRRFLQPAQSQRRWVWGAAGLALVSIALGLAAARPDPAHALTAGSVLAGLAELRAAPPPPPEPPLAERVQALDAEAGPLEKAGMTGPDVAALQLRRGLAHLEAFREGGDPRHLRVAHELLLRTKDNVWRHPRPEPLQAEADEVLAELHAQPTMMAEAGIELEPLTRYAIAILMRHGEGAEVHREFVDEGEPTLVCVEPCTWAVPVGPKGGEAIRVELDGEQVGMLGWNPQRALDSPAHF